MTTTTTTPPTSPPPSPSASASASAAATTTAAKKQPYVPPTTSKVLASTLGILPASMLASAVIGRFLPVSQTLAISFAYVLWLPLWIGGACWIARAPSAKRGWAFVALATLVTALGALAIPH